MTNLLEQVKGNNGASNSIAAISNLQMVRTAAERLKGRNPSLPGIAVLYGPAGYGKTTAAIAIANENRAFFVALKSAWPRKTMLEKILIEMSIKPVGSTAQLLDLVCENLAVTGRMLMIDEADYLIRSDSLIELVRDIYEGSQGTILLIGEELLPKKLKKWERFHSRILHYVPAQPVTIGDAAILAQIYCPNVNITSDLLEFLVVNSGGSVRRVSVNLANIYETANIEGWTDINRKIWADRGLYTGDAPLRERA